MTNQSRSQNPIEIVEQRQFWNDWNSKHREQNKILAKVNLQQASMVNQWMQELNRNDLDILEVGCGSGWLCEQLLTFGQVTGTDLSDEVLARSESRLPEIKFVAGDFLELDFASSSFDVIVLLEVLAHVGDQTLFLEKIARLLRPGGYLMLSTQNKFVLERWTQVVPRAAGQIRNWVDAKSLKRLLHSNFEVSSITSIFPVGDIGILRWTNAPKVNNALSLLMSPARIDALKERLFLGHTLMALARKRAEGR
jgi:2-polyprenyl-3-methyl-5-hydroxy-6-metoxy-1,4-benzoquinol methylase